MKLNEFASLLDEVKNSNDSMSYLFEKNDSIKIVGVRNSLDKKIISFKEEETVKRGVKRKSILSSFLFKYYTNLSVEELNKNIVDFYNESEIKSIDAVILYLLNNPDKNDKTLYDFANEFHNRTNYIVKNLKYEFYIEEDGNVSIWVLGGVYIRQNTSFIMDIEYVDIISKFNKIHKSNSTNLKKVNPISIKHQEFENEGFDVRILNNNHKKMKDKVVTVEGKEKKDKEKKIKESKDKMIDEVLLDLKKISLLNEREYFVSRINTLNKTEKQKLFNYLKENDNAVTQFILKNHKILIEKDVNINRENNQKIILNTMIEDKKPKKEKEGFFKRLFSKEDTHSYFLKEQLKTIEKNEFNYEGVVEDIIEWVNKFSEIIPKSHLRDDLTNLVNECSYELIMLLKSNLNIFTMYLSEVLIKRVDELYNLLKKENLSQYEEHIDTEFYDTLFQKFQEIMNMIELYKDFLLNVFELDTEVKEEDGKNKINNIKKSLDNIDLF